jgi:flagellar FliL protein
MATAPKAAPKAGPKAVAAPEAQEAPAKSSKKLIIIAVVALILLGGAGGGAAWFLTRGGSGNAHAAKEEAKSEPAKAPTFVPMEPFTVNLQSENGDQFLQTTFTLQVPDAVQEELVKNYMPQLRSRLLLLLSSKKATEISTIEGKKKLHDEIITAVNQPFSPNGKPQGVIDVFFTSFVIQ